MYPEINALVDRLHGQRISTFLVTNAQFPDRILQLKPVTQLYVSVDAATPESLKVRHGNGRAGTACGAQERVGLLVWMQESVNLCLRYSTCTARASYDCRRRVALNYG